MHLLLCFGFEKLPTLCQYCLPYVNYVCALHVMVSVRGSTVSGVSKYFRTGAQSISPGAQQFLVTVVR